MPEHIQFEVIAYIQKQVDENPLLGEIHYFDKGKILCFLSCVQV